MSAWVRTCALLLCSLGMLMGAVGCKEADAKMGEGDQNAKSAMDRITDLQRQLDRETQARIRAEEDALALRSENDKLKEQLAGQGRGGEAGGWTAIAGGAMLSIEGTVLFDSGKADLKKPARPIVDSIAKVIKEKFPGYEIYVFGHTDSEPIKASGWKDNLQLSCERAATVIRTLRGAGAKQEMIACGWGIQRPTADNASVKGRQANRRVEIFALTPKAAGHVSLSKK